MFGFSPATRIYLAPGATDMRKSFEGLYGLVRDRLLCDPRMGHVFEWPRDCTHHAKINQRIRITHPFHPLSGQQFDLLEYCRIYSESYVYFHDDCGQLRIIPAIWTDFVKVDAFVELAAGTSPLHTPCLLELADLVHRVGREKGQDV